MLTEIKAPFTAIYEASAKLTYCSKPKRDRRSSIEAGEELCLATFTYARQAAISKLFAGESCVLCEIALTCSLSDVERYKVFLQEECIRLSGLHGTTPREAGLPLGDVRV